MTTSFGTLRRGSARPFYQQIKDAFLDKIQSGLWVPGEKVPSEHTLVEELGVSRMTVNRAMRELTQQGHLQRVHGVGTFVADPVGRASLIELRNIADEIQAVGKTHRARVDRLESIAADATVADHLEIEIGVTVYRIVVVHFQDDVAIQLEDRVVNPNLVPDFLQVDFEQMTPTKYLMKLFRPDEIEHTVKAVTASLAECRALDIYESEPCLRLDRRTWKGAAVVTAASLLYPSSRYHLVARYKTDHLEIMSN